MNGYVFVEVYERHTHSVEADDVACLLCHSGIYIVDIQRGADDSSNFGHHRGLPSVTPLRLFRPAALNDFGIQIFVCRFQLNRERLGLVLVINHSDEVG